MSRRRLPIVWAVLGATVLAQIAYPLTEGAARAHLTVLTVLLGYLLSVGHALLTRGPRVAAALVAVTTGGGLTVEALGVATGVPFGGYDYSGDLGPMLLGVPLIIPLAWTWMAWPAWLAALRLARGAPARIGLAGLGLATWDVFLDPQMVSAGYWSWHEPTPALPGVPGIPVGNYLGWLVVALAMMALLSLTGGPATPAGDADLPMYGLYLWTYASSVLAHAVFFDLPASAAWGALAMAPVALTLAVTLARARRSAPA
ncbi:putative membrane protein [Micromonospora pattaloongensis]|uniref:Putative membrane protein n=1 Tax=Micromonospora pattaloongensis TaxID=405436 RepID=A0A1H3Q1G4_9ACTN|nr:carotenoid biosynthesis protein [Micromonospora pattaloongensis]SDZ07080.1 putative membrane protein [Micromonospora pattaloongensis]